MPKIELGQVHYLTEFLEFPDGSVWTDQTAIAGASSMAIHLFLKNLKLPGHIKSALQSYRKFEFKDGNGVWCRFRIETTRRDKVWPKDKADLIRRRHEL